MKVMIDTNVFISAALFPNGAAAQALYKAISYPYTPVTSDYVIDEIRRKMQEKFPHRIDEINDFISSIFKSIEIISTPITEVESEQKVRDIKDRPILRAALNIGADILITGDKDFLEANIDDPRIMSVHDFNCL